MSRDVSGVGSRLGEEQRVSCNWSRPPLTCEMAQRAAARGHPGRVTMLEPHFVFDLHDLPKGRLSGRSHTV